MAPVAFEIPCGKSLEMSAALAVAITLPYARLYVLNCQGVQHGTCFRCCGRQRHFVLQVLEVEGVGVGVRHIRRIYAHNPTANDFDFQCEPAEALTQNGATAGKAILGLQPFKCLTRRGRIFAGKKTELAFEYTPTQLGVCERLWTFSIPCGSPNAASIIKLLRLLQSNPRNDLPWPRKVSAGNPTAPHVVDITY